MLGLLARLMEVSGTEKEVAEEEVDGRIVVVAPR